MHGPNKCALTSTNHSQAQSRAALITGIYLSTRLDSH
jgi:hypothetical protein